MIVKILNIKITAFLIVYSECAKNSLLHKLLIINLICSNKLRAIDLEEIFITAAQNCDNGEIGYLSNNLQKFSKIMDKCSIKE